MVITLVEYLSNVWIIDNGTEKLFTGLHVVSDPEDNNILKDDYFYSPYKVSIKNGIAIIIDRCNFIKFALTDSPYTEAEFKDIVTVEAYISQIYSCGITVQFVNDGTASIGGIFLNTNTGFDPYSVLLVDSLIQDTFLNGRVSFSPAYSIISVHVNVDNSNDVRDIKEFIIWANNNAFMIRLFDKDGNQLDMDYFSTVNITFNYIATF